MPSALASGIPWAWSWSSKFATMRKAVTTLARFATQSSRKPRHNAVFNFSHSIHRVSNQVYELADVFHSQRGTHECVRHAI